MVWLTTPIDCTREEVVRVLEDGLGPIDQAGRRWGRSIDLACRSAIAAAEALEKGENPLRRQLDATIRGLRESHIDFRIFCQRGALGHYSYLSLNGQSEGFIHSLAEYRDSDPFDMLVKVGPLRSLGWGAIPDAILTAPRQAHVLQLVWSNCRDDESFGNDPIVSGVEPLAASDIAPRPRRVFGGLPWRFEVSTVGEDEPLPGEQALEADDEFRLEIRRGHSSNERRSATLIELPDGHGMLCRPRSRLLGFNPSPGLEEPFADDWTVGETLVPGMYIIDYSDLRAVDLGRLQASQGEFSREWKRRLSEAVRRNRVDLVRRLRRDGIHLRTLNDLVDRWSERNGNVIRAPNAQEHFRILISALGLAFGSDDRRARRGEWWLQAWAEIARTRSAAIRDGVQANDIVRQELIGILLEEVSDIRELASMQLCFPYGMPADAELEGNVCFRRILGVEDGFLAPDVEVERNRSLVEFETWRA